MTNKANQNTGRDTTIEDIHKTRERISDECKGDVHAITEAARKRQQASGRAIVSYAKEAGQSPVVPR